jgi:hypothetical protein
MKDVLMIMNAREIPAVLKSIRDLPIDQAWFTGYTEMQLESEIEKFISLTDYDNYIITSDDLMGNSSALDLVRKQLINFEVASGYCNLFPGSPLVNLIRSRIEEGPPHCGDLPQSAQELFMLRKDADNYPNPVFRVYFAGFALTGMRKKIWHTHPFRCVHSWPGHASDHMTCLSLQRDDIPIMAVSGAYSEHLGGSTQGFKHPLIIGIVKPHVTLVKWGQGI